MLKVGLSYRIGTDSRAKLGEGDNPKKYPPPKPIEPQNLTTNILGL